jgi:predicted nucleotidyltransferase component of viral defense system
MDTFQRHEIFEIEVLDKMHRSRALEPLVFGGGTMLRLCHELPRYSVDLDFWVIKPMDEEAYRDRLQRAFEKDYEVTDAEIKYHSILFELRTPRYPRRLKIEIRRTMEDWDVQQKIAFSRHATVQVPLMAHTLEQTMKNKVSAFLDRNEIRDCFDMEFMLRRGVALPPLDASVLRRLRARVQGLGEKDFKVKLGSVLENDIRAVYTSQGFAYLNEKLHQAMAAAEEERP